MEAPSPSELLRYPAVGGLCVIALGLYAAVPPDAVEPLQLDLRALSLPPFGPEPWRLLTSALLHAGQLQGPDMLGGLIHAGFNCYWLWTLGTAIEQRLGHLATLTMLVLFAVGGALLEYAFNGAAVGLSGVVYGVAALLTVLARRSPRWRGTIDARTTKFFAVWFLICVAATAADIMAIANFAHAGGAILGALLGWAMVERGPRRAMAAVALAGCLGLFFAGATVARPWINFNPWAGYDAMLLAERADKTGDLAQAVAWAERGVGYRRTPADHWAYLSGLYLRADRLDEARAALAEAVARAPENADYRSALGQLDEIAGR